ncbi:replication-relaxation family protein [Embleya sp. NBC_00896]|uniref:replication-relaxation family protein n=1 Tax=Embleya sp. NBC_00896 TaxID=2975961 RepID=UPI00386963A7|nr:replication-relaxation family protein [Embleya sp. NBC_00896]
MPTHHGVRTALRRPRPHMTPRNADVAALTHRLTARDRWLIRLLHDHDVLTTNQIIALTGRARRATTRRLSTLHSLGILDAFRPFLTTGSSPYHYTLGPAGAAILAAERAVDVRALGWRPDATSRIAHSPWLAHDVGRNDFMVRLAADHHRPENRMTLWAGEHVCKALWADHIHPDAYAHITHTPTDGGRRRTVAFFLEHDTGSMRPERVDAKLTGYADLAASTHPPTSTLVLVHASTPGREKTLRALLGPTSTSLGVPVATTNATAHAADSPLADVWLPIGTRAERTTLLGLRQAFPQAGPAPVAPGTWTPDATDPQTHGALPWPPTPPLPPSAVGPAAGPTPHREAR